MRESWKDREMMLRGEDSESLSLSLSLHASSLRNRQGREKSKDEIRKYKEGERKDMQGSGGGRVRSIDDQEEVKENDILV